MSNGSAGYALAQDIGPVGSAYRPAIFSKYHLAVPKTWALVRGRGGNSSQGQPEYVHDLLCNDDATLQGLTSQAGGQMFQQSGSSWKVELNNPYSQKVMAFWGQLIKEGAIPVESLGSPAYGKAIASGEFASYLEAAWDPTYLAGFMVGARTAAAADDQPAAAERVGQAVLLRLRRLVVRRHQPVPDGRPRRCRQVSAGSSPARKALPSCRASTLKPGQPGAGEGEFAAASARATVPDFNADIAQFVAQPNVFSLFNVFSGQVRPGFVWSPFENYVSDEWPTLVTSATSGSISFSQA